GPGRPGEPAREYLADPADLLTWAPRAGLLDAAEATGVGAAWATEPGAAAAALRAVREVREALHTVLLAALAVAPAGAPATLGALQRLHARWAAAAARAVLDVQPGRQPPVRLLVGAQPAHLLPDRAAQAALDLLGAGDFGR